ncbi:MAG: hypothetical protein AMXMBFR7_36830 [Planctomycetota bacterium]
MLVGFDTEYSFRRVVDLGGGRTHADVTTLQPVCACLVFDDGRELRLTEHYGQLQRVLDDPENVFIVHGAHAELGFCRAVGLRFPNRYFDTLTMLLMVLHASAFKLPGGFYRAASLGNLASRFHIPFIGEGEKDEIREAIMRGEHAEKFGLQRVLEYCTDDARTSLKAFGPLMADLKRHCGPTAERNLVELYQPYTRLMAQAASRGLRFDQHAWSRLQEAAPRYREPRLELMRSVGYDHDGEGLGSTGFTRMISNLGLAQEWPKTPTRKLSAKEEHLKEFRGLHPAINAAYELRRFDSFMGQDIGSRVDLDGRLRCGILPLAQHTGRNSTVSPNLMGMPGELRPLLLPDEGCVFLHFDFSQQEPGIAGWISGCVALLQDFANGDVYLNLGRRLGLIRDDMTPEEQRRVRKTLLKALMLAILYGKGIRSIASDLGVPYQTALAHLSAFQRAYRELFDYLKAYVSAGLERGWAENAFGFRACFAAQPGVGHGHLARSCQNFPIQSAAATCFQLTGLYLDDLGLDIRLPIHDAYLLSVLDDRKAIAEARKRIVSATANAVSQLFPGLMPRRDIEVLRRFAKDGKEDSLETMLAGLEAAS